MRRSIFIENLKGSSVEEREVEIVERKGFGHPDSICDAISEAASQSLSQYYLKKFGLVLHHNLDKGLLVAGRSEPKFKGGKILEPIRIIIAGRATDRVGQVKIPIKKFVEKAARDYLVKILNLSEREIKKNFEISINYQPGAANLQEVFKKSNKIAIANDTSFGVAHGPLSLAEKLTLDLANFINSNKFSQKFPFVGKDIKVMTLRRGDEFSFTLAIAFIGKYIKNVKDYFEKKEKIKKEAINFIGRNQKISKFQVEINTLDNPQAKNESEIYLTCTGLSAEQGDDGQVGRGNRICGLITPSRQMSMEAAAGKNINHPGKLYQILSYLIAQEIGKIKGVKECQVKILSEIGKPLDLPQMVLVELRAENFSQIKEKAFSVCEKKFAHLKTIQENIITGKYQLF